MSIFKKHKKDEENIQIQKQEQNEEITDTSNHILMGERDVFSLKDNKDDVVVVGKLQGTVHIGDAVYLTNVGEDEEALFLTTICGIETGPSISVKEATDCNVALILEKGRHFRIKKGSVLFSRDCLTKDVRTTYTNTLGDVFVGEKNLDISDQEYAVLSIADCAEIWRLYIWFQSKVKKEEPNPKDEKIEKLREVLCKKLMNAESIHCVFSKLTGEPHMFSRTINQKNGSYMCMAPYILLGTKQYMDSLMTSLPKEKYEIRKIENGADRKGIYNFLGSTFYLNGACGVSVQADHMMIPDKMLVPKPDYSNMKPQNVPVTNPDLVRWLLLIGQLGKPENAEAEIVYKLYYRFMSKELTKANLLVPMQCEGEIPKGDAEGKTVLQKDTQIKIVTMNGKYDRPAVRMYTDWKRLRMVYGDEWNGLIQKVSGMIAVYDCAINVTQYVQAGCYVSKECYEEMEKME